MSENGVCLDLKVLRVPRVTRELEVVTEDEVKTSESSVFPDLMVHPVLLVTVANLVRGAVLATPAQEAHLVLKVNPVILDLMASLVLLALAMTREEVPKETRANAVSVVLAALMANLARSVPEASLETQAEMVPRVHKVIKVTPVVRVTKVPTAHPVLMAAALVDQLAQLATKVPADLAVLLEFQACRVIKVDARTALRVRKVVLEFPARLAHQVLKDPLVRRASVVFQGWTVVSVLMVTRVTTVRHAADC